MTVTVHAEDYDNFNPNQVDIAIGAGDNENGRCTQIGWARPFPSSGDVTRTITCPSGRRRRASTSAVATSTGRPGSVARTTSSPSDRAGSTVHSNPSSTKTGTGEVRHDLESLTKRFTALGTPVSATWMSGTLTGGAPGPSTYWIDAVVELSPDAELRTKATTNLPAPAVEADVSSTIPAGALRGGPGLDAAFALGGFRAKAYLIEGTNAVVLAALGQ